MRHVRPHLDSAERQAWGRASPNILGQIHVHELKDKCKRSFPVSLRVVANADV